MRSSRGKDVSCLTARQLSRVSDELLALKSRAFEI